MKILHATQKIEMTKKELKAASVYNSQALPLHPKVDEHRRRHQRVL
jgi:hypothetical protein